MGKEEKEKFYLFTLVNISEDSGLNGEFENKLFCSYRKARQFMEECIATEMSVQKQENLCNAMLERIDEGIANLWINTNFSEGVMYRISEVSPI